MSPSHRVIAASLAALGSAAVLAIGACDRDKPATEVPAAAPPATRVRVPDGIEPLTAQQEAERDVVGPSDADLEQLLEAGEVEFPSILEGSCGADASCASAADASCGVCGAVADSGS